MPALPTPRRDGRYAVEVVCSGNICRSPSAAVVLGAKALAAGLDGVEVTSSGIGDWHVGNPMDERSAQVLAGAGYQPDHHRARQVDAAALPAYDLVLAMDRSHLDDLLDLGADPGRTMLFGEFDPVSPGAEVPDPYYGGPEGFEEVLRMVERTSAALVDRLRTHVAAPRPTPSSRGPATT
jgi:protein-tyrosine phosphatase